MATIGINIAGGEFGGTGGTHNINYHYPTFSELKFYADKGVDLVRLPISWERVQDALGGQLDLSGDIALIKQVLVDAAALGMDVIIDVHNYGRYKGVPLGAAGGPTPAQFADFWKKMAVEFKDYPALAGYDLMNEPHDMPTATIWKESAQAATNAIRTVDMENTIIIEGDNWSGAHSWLHSNANLIITDPANKIVYQAHQYFDKNHSGTYANSYDVEGAYPTMGADRIKPFVDWLKANGLQGMIGETGVPSNDPRWIEVMKNSLDYMQANDLDVTAWAGGSWWSPTYSMYIGRPGSPDSAFGDLLETYYNDFDGFQTSSWVQPPAPIAPDVVIGDKTVNEADGTVTFTVSRSGDLTKASSVNYSTGNGTAAAGSDYTAAVGTLNFAAGEATKTVTVAIVNDTTVESPETFTVNLSGGTNVVIKDGTGVGTINSDDVAPPPPVAPTVAVGDVAVNEGAGVLVFTVARSGDLSGASSVNYATADGSAVAGSDYTAVSGTVTFAAGQATATVTVQIINDTLVENPESLFLNLSGGTNVTIGDGQGVGTINSDDVAPPPPTGTIMGTSAGETINGTSGADIIDALGGNDVLNGRGGADRLTGGSGSDRFVFDSRANASGDVVTDFTVGLDKLDFSAIDANPFRRGDQKFTWLDSGAFTGKAGQLREYNLDGKHFVAGDLNGDRVADFTIEVAGTTNLTSADIFF